jgi:hypothetical protein
VNDKVARSSGGEVRGTLACERCGKDLLDTVNGIFVFVLERREFMRCPRYEAVHWWCKVPCQDRGLADLGWERWPTHPKDGDDAANPLEFPRWHAKISRQIEQGSFSPLVATRLLGAMFEVARAAAREPTADDIARFRQKLTMEGLL